MIAVLTSPQIVSKLKKNQNLNLDISCYNSTKETVVSGQNEDLEQFKMFLKKKKILFVPLHVDGPFHSKHYSYMSSQFYEYLKTQNFLSFKIPIMSTIDGRLHHHPYLEIIKSQCYSPVLFMQAILQLKKLNITEFLDCGDGTLSKLLLSI